MDNRLGHHALTYLTQRAFGVVGMSVAQRLIRTLTKRRDPPSRETMLALRLSLLRLLLKDLRNVIRGYYPRSLLFPAPWIRHRREMLNLAYEIAQSELRRRRGAHDEIPGEVKRAAYPSYYQRTFHWQSDGYFSARSARLYDPSVEFLFVGVADAMRRQVIPPIAEWLRGRPDLTSASLADLACGTSAIASDLMVALPNLNYLGFDLSHPYLAHAKKTRHDARVSVANVENIPLEDQSTDIVLSIYLFHELPRQTRRKVLREAFRILKPGGLIVIEDSLQTHDSAKIAPLLQRFDVDFHEPFYRQYIDDSLEETLSEVGFSRIKSQNHFVAKVVCALRPAMN